MSSRTPDDSTLGPLSFKPLIRQAIWGGTRLASLLHKPSTHLDDCSESWEVVDLGDDQSIVESGPHTGTTLKRLVENHSEPLLGRHAHLDAFPLLIKFLDATDRLSLQVHPDNTTARRLHPGQQGKTEAWVILAAEPDSRLWVGLKSGTTASQLETAIADDNIDSCVNSFPARTGQCLVVPAGTVHAIGAGIVLAEIQQPSDLTYRLFDWGRFGRDGSPRRIDLEHGLEAVNFDADRVVVAEMSNTKNTESVTLFQRPEFRVLHHHVTSPLELVNDNRCRILTTIGGNGSLEYDGIRIELSAGRTVMLPAEVRSVWLDTSDTSDSLSLLDSHLP